MKIIKLEAENIKRLRAVRIEPSGPVVIIGGRNAQGKSSTLDAIEIALGGKASIPPEPVRRGARRARIVADLGDIVVERTFSPKGTELVVKDAAGVPQRSPQALLDALCSRVAFDPLAFARMKPAEQDRVLRDLLGIDTADLDKSRAALYAERTAVSRDAKALAARADAAPTYRDAPPEAVSIEALLQRLDEETTKDRAVQSAKQKADQFADNLERASVVRDRLKAQLERLAAELADVEDDVKTFSAAFDRQQKELNSMAKPDTDSVKAALANAQRVNAEVAANDAWRKLREQADAASERVDVLSDAITSIDEEKAARIAAARFPVEGLGFDESGPTLHGIPLEQASQAERLRVSVAIGLALHPQLKVLLIRDGSVLDDDSMRMVADMAANADAQVWLERVGSGDPSAIVIEDGSVLDDETREANA